MNPQSYTIEDGNDAHSHDCFLVNCLEETSLLMLALAAGQKERKQFLHASIDVIWSLHWRCSAWLCEVHLRLAFRSVEDYRWESAKQPGGMEASTEAAP